jgi:uncharacterized protein YcfL
MKKFTILAILTSLLLVSCSMDSLLKKDSPKVSDDAAMEKEVPTDDAMMVPKDDAMAKEDAPADSMMKAQVEVNAAMQ